MRRPACAFALAALLGGAVPRAQAAPIVVRRPPTEMAPMPPVLSGPPPPPSGSVRLPDLAASAMENARRLAEQLHDDEALLELAIRNAAHKNAPVAAVEALARASEAAGVPARGIELLSRRVALGWSVEATLPLLASLLDRAGRSGQAGETWARLAVVRGARGLAAEEALAYARILARADDPEGALRALHLVVEPPLADRAYWQALVEVAWQVGNDVETLRAGEVLWKHGERSPELARRLFLVASDKGELGQASAVARASFEASGRTDLLLDAASSQADAGRWKEAGEMLTLARTKQELFASEPAYWAMEGRWLSHQGDSAGAMAAAERASKLFPSSAALVGELLWRALEARDVAALERAVHVAERAGSAKQPVAAEPLGLALIVLGRDKEALRLWSQPGFSAEVVARAPDALADALDAVGRVESAARLRQVADRRLAAQPRVASLDAVEDADKALRFAEMIGRRQGAEAEARWLGHLLASSPGADRKAKLEVAARLAESLGRTQTSLGFLRQLEGLRGLTEAERLRAFESALEERDLGALRREVERRRSALVAPPARASSPAARAEGALMIEATLALRETPLARELLSRAEPSPETALLARALEEREEQEATHVRAGGTYESVEAVTARGPDVEVLVPRRSWAVRGLLGARELSVPSSPGMPAKELREGTVLAALGRTSSFSSYELAVGASLHSAGTLPRARATWESQLDRWAFLAARAELNGPSDDAPLLRALAAQSSVEVSFRAQTDQVYALAEGAVRDDRTRTFRQLGTQFEQEAEVGVRLSRQAPAVEAGLRLHVQQRQNVARLPLELERYWPAERFLTSELPQSYTFLAAVFRLVEGNINLRPDAARRLRPHYECLVEGGLRFPERDWATAASCSASARLGPGFLSASASYSWGLLAVAQSYSTQVSLAYNLLF